MEGYFRGTAQHMAIVVCLLASSKAQAILNRKGSRHIEEHVIQIAIAFTSLQFWTQFTRVDLAPSDLSLLGQPCGPNCQEIVPADQARRSDRTRLWTGNSGNAAHTHRRSATCRPRPRLTHRGPTPSASDRDPQRLLLGHHGRASFLNGSPHLAPAPASRRPHVPAGGRRGPLRDCL